MGGVVLLEFGYLFVIEKVLPDSGLIGVFGGELGKILRKFLRFCYLFLGGETMKRLCFILLKLGIRFLS